MRDSPGDIVSRYKHSELTVTDIHNGYQLTVVRRYSLKGIVVASLYPLTKRLAKSAPFSVTIHLDPNNKLEVHYCVLWGGYLTRSYLLML